MTDEFTLNVRTLIIALLAATMGLVLFTPSVSAQEAQCTAVLENGSELHNTSSAPGGLLAEAIGDQRDEIGNELDDRGFNARIENATSNRSRAGIVAEEVERIEANLSTVERCWGINRSEGVANRSLAELNDDERAALENYTHELHRRFNETETEAERLRPSLRDAYDVDAETMTALERRIVTARNATAHEEQTSDWPFPFP